MRNKFKKIIEHPLISGSIIIFAGTLFANFLNFLFNLFMSRTLSVSDYGILASLTSLILVFALIADSFAPTIVHFAASSFAKKEYEKIQGIFFQANKIAIVFGGLTFLVFTLFAENIGNFFNINNNFLVILVGIIVFLGFLGALNRAILQAKLSFKYISLVYVSSTSIKLIIGIILVFFGYKATGAMFGFVFSFFAMYLLFFIPLKRFLEKSNNSYTISIKKLFTYGGPASIALFSLTFFITSDILLVKHFFSAKEAGIYAGLSLVGRVIYFFTAPLTSVMFPVIVQKYSREENYTNTFKISFFLVLILSAAITIFYFINPGFSIRFFLKKEEYIAASAYLPYFGIFIALYSLLSLVTNFYLSIKRTKIYILITFFAVFQIILIWFNHETFFQVITISLLATGLPLVILLLYYIWLYERKTKN